MPASAAHSGGRAVAKRGAEVGSSGLLVERRAWCVLSRHQLVITSFRSGSGIRTGGAVSSALAAIPVLQRRAIGHRTPGVSVARARTSPLIARRRQDAPGVPLA
jgi:hypothetical protein